MKLKIGTSTYGLLNTLSEQLKDYIANHPNKFGDFQLALYALSQSMP